MKTRTINFSVAVVLIVVATSTALAQQPRTRQQRPAAPAANAPKQDLKIRYRQNSGGQTMESVVMLKGKRERNETRMGQGMDMVTITQCDLKRNVQINSQSRKYLVTPMVAGETSTSVTAPTTSPAPAGEVSRRGGVVTYTTSAVDTGERKELFGFVARRVKTSMRVESSPDACSPTNQRMEIDGWYIDFAYGLDCDLNQTPVMTNPMAEAGCRDRYQFKRQGAARTGYALSETTTMYDADGKVIFSSSKEVVDLSREPLDAALFEVPSDYAEAASMQEFHGVPALESMADQMKSEADDSVTPANSSVKAAGVIRIGVMTINNRAGKDVSAEALRTRLVGSLVTAGVEAVPLNAISKTEAELEGRQKQCDFILSTDLVTLKSSAAKKLGGMFGRAAGVGGIDKTEAKVEFKLFAIGESAPRLQASASAKEEGEEASAGAALDSEAQQVIANVRRR